MEQLPASIDKRPRYFATQQLNTALYTAAQYYVLDRLRRPSRACVAAGILEGLTVTAGTDEVYVAPGTAMDAQGRQIVLSTSRQVPLQEYRGQTLDLVIGYWDEESDNVGSGATRWWEKPYIGPRQAAPAEVTDALLLARVQVTAAGQVTTASAGRQMAGVRLPTETGGVAAPTLRGGAAGGVAVRTPDGTQGLEVTATTLTTSGTQTNQDLQLQPRGTGAVVLQGPLRITGATTVEQTLTVQGNYLTSLGGALSVAGATTLQDTLTVQGDKLTTLGGGLTVTGTAQLKSTLSVSGPVSINGAPSDGYDFVLQATAGRTPFSVLRPDGQQAWLRVSAQGTVEVAEALTVSGVGTSTFAGKVGIGTTGALTEALEVHGTVTATAVQATGTITSPLWRVVHLLRARKGPLPQIVEFETRGGTVMLFASGTGDPAVTTPQGGLLPSDNIEEPQVPIGMDLAIDNMPVGTARAFTKRSPTDGPSPQTFTATILMDSRLAAGTHTLQLTAAVTPNFSCTYRNKAQQAVTADVQVETDTDGYTFDVILIEWPF